MSYDPTVDVWPSIKVLPDLDRPESNQYEKCYIIRSVMPVRKDGRRIYMLAKDEQTYQYYTTPYFHGAKRFEFIEEAIDHRELIEKEIGVDFEVVSISVA